MSKRLLGLYKLLPYINNVYMKSSNVFKSVLPVPTNLLLNVLIDIH